MNQNTLHAIDTFFTAYELIKTGKKPESTFKKTFEYLSRLDYRSEHQKKVEYYIDIFAKGAVREIPIDDKFRTARNSPNYHIEKDIKFYCEQFIKEHYVHVQKNFWKRYKGEINKYKNYYGYQPQPIKPVEILEVCKSLKIKKKN